MKKMMIVVAMVIGLLVSGCATDRIWQNPNSQIPSSKNDVSKSLQECEKTELVSISHQKAHDWRTASWVLVWVPYVGLLVHEFGLRSAQTNYVGRLEDCMMGYGYRNFPQTGGLKWDYHSSKDYSKEEFLERIEKEKLEQKKYDQPASSGGSTGWGGK